MSIEQIESSLSASRYFTPLLPPAVELAFRESECEPQRRQAVSGVALGTLFYVLLLTFDWVIAPDVYAWSAIVRLGVGLPISLIALRVLLVPGRSRATYQWVVALAACSDSLTFSAVLTTSHAPTALTYLSANLIVLAFTINLVGLGTRAAILVCGAVMTITMTAVVLSPLSTPGDVVCFLTVGSMVAMACVLANWCLQNERRRSYLTLHRDGVRLRQISLQRDLLERLAAIDPLTGLANRRGFEAMLEGDLAAAGEGARLSVAMLDVDCFKAFNDTYGHLKGDEVLTNVAHALAETCGSSMRLGRVGGEEFAVAMLNVDAPALRAIGERLRRAVEQLALPHDTTVAGPVVTISVGIASGRLDGDADRAALFARADEALYAAKRAGRNRVVVSVETGTAEQTDGLVAA